MSLIELILLLICIGLFIIFIISAVVIITSKPYPILFSLEGEKTFFNPQEGKTDSKSTSNLT